MTIELTEQQQRSLDARDGTPQRVIDPRTGARYVLVLEAEYEGVQEVLEDERRQQAIRAIGRRNAMGRMGEPK